MGSISLRPFSRLMYLVGISLIVLPHILCDIELAPHQFLQFSRQNLIKPNNITLIGNDQLIEYFDDESSSSVVDGKESINEWISQLNGWEEVTDRWPTTEPRDGEDKKFFFNSDNSEQDFVTLKFKSDWINKNIPANSVVEISFKVWVSSKGKNDSPSLDLSGVSQTTINLFERYIKTYPKGKPANWMLYTVRINSNLLSKFEISYKFDYLFVAFRQFQVKFNTFIEIKQSDEVKLEPIESGNDLACLPPDIPKDEGKTTLYISNCVDCAIGFRDKIDKPVDLEIWTNKPKDLNKINENEFKSKELNQLFQLAQQSVSAEKQLKFRMSSTSSCNSILVRMNSSLKLDDKFNEKWTLIEKNSAKKTYFSIKSKEIQFPTKGISLGQVCIEFDYHFDKVIDSSNLGRLELSYNLMPSEKGTLYRQKFTSILLSTQTRESSLRFCLHDYINFESKDYSLVLAIESKQRDNLLFWYRITDVNFQDGKTIDFLLPFGKTEPNTAYELEQFSEETSDELWHQQWNIDFYQFEDYFTLFSDSIGFTTFSVMQHAMTTLSTKWIRYNEYFSKAELKFRLTLNNSDSKIENYLQVYPRICNQLGQCSVGSVEPLKNDKNDKTFRDYVFQLPPSKTELFRLEFVFKFEKPDGEIPKNEDVKFSLFDVAHPCLSADKNGNIIKNVVCKNDGVCRPTMGKSLLSCKCPVGYSGEKCEIIDRCVIKANNAQSGFEICKSHDLKCQPEAKENFSCLCTGEKNLNKTVWKEKECVVKKPEPTKDSENYITYQFNNTDNLPKDYNLCFEINYEVSINESHVSELEKSLDARPTIHVHFNSESTTLFRHVIDLRKKTMNLKFCLLDLISPRYFHSTPDFSVSFIFTTFTKTPQPESVAKFLDYKLKKSINLWLKETNKMLLKRFDSIEDYETTYQKNLKFGGWNFGLLGEEHAKDITVNDDNLVVIKTSKSIEFSTLISEWFVVNQQMESLSIAYQTKCSGKDLPIVSAKVLFLDSGEPKIFELKKILDDPAKFDFTGLKEIFKKVSSRTLFKLILEIKSECEKLSFWPLIFGPKLSCSGGDMACGGKDIGECRPNYAEGIAQCKCKDVKYFGDNCQLTNPCLSGSKGEEECARFPRAKSSEKSKLCKAFTNTTFTCACWPGVFEWNEKTQSCTPMFKQQDLTKQFTELPDDFYLEKVVSVTKDTKVDGNLKWMNRPDYWTAVGKLTRPFYFALKPITSDLLVTVPKVSKDKDLCLKMSYFLTFGSQIGLSIGTNDYVWFDESKVKFGDKSDSQFCIRSLIHPEAKELANVKLNVAAKYSELDKIKEGLQFVAIGFDDSFKLDDFKQTERLNLKAQEFNKDIFPLQIPSGLWDFKDNSIVFKKSFDSDETQTKRVSYILSDWFTNDPRLQSHTLRYKISFGKNQTSIELKPVAFNTKMLLIEPLNVSEKDNVVTINSTLIKDNLYRFGFRVVTSGKPNETVTVSGVDLDDFCALGLISEKEKCKNDGKCLINLNETLNYKCECLDGFTDSDCGIRDYCTGKYTSEKTGNEICGNNEVNGKCVNQNGQFICDCKGNPDKVWMSDEKICKGLRACLVNNPCQSNQYCYEGEDPEDPTKKKALCKCVEGYHENDANKQCEKIDPCKSRKVKCGKVYHSQCVPTVTGLEATKTEVINDPDAHSFCYCDDGYVQNQTKTEIQQKFVCEPKNPCQSPLLNNCEQKCEVKKKDNSYKCGCFAGYQLDPTDPKKPHCIPLANVTMQCDKNCTALNSYCDEKVKKCKCKLDSMEYVGNYRYQNSSLDICKPKNLMGFKECPDEAAEIDFKTGKLTCNCSNQDLYISDANLGICQLKPICGKGGVGLADCDNRNALCVVTDLQKGLKNNGKLDSKTLYTCVCRPGQHLTKDEKCVDLCDDELIKSECDKRNAYCNSAALKQIAGNAIFTVTNNTDWSDLCRCKEAFVASVDLKTRFTCNIISSKSDSKIYNIKLTISKSTYDTLKDFKQYINLLSESVFKQTVSIESYRKKLPAENFNQLVAEYKDSKQMIAKSVASQISSIEVSQGQPIIDRLLQSMIVQYIPKDSSDMAIRTISCLDLTADKLYIDCAIEITVKNSSKFENDLHINMPGDKSDKNLERYIADLFKQNCHKNIDPDGERETDDCVILVQKIKKNDKRSAFVAEEMELLANEENAQDSVSEKIMPDSIVLKQSSIKSLKAEPFNACLQSSSKDKCPELTECTPNGNTYKCSCNIAKDSQIFIEVLDKNSKQDSIINKCEIKQDNEICQQFCGKDQQDKVNYNETCKVDKPKLTAVNVTCYCKDKAVSISKLSKPEKLGYITVLNECVGKIEHLCANLHCNTTNTRTQTCSLKVNSTSDVVCDCLPGWEGVKCDEKIADKKEKEDKKKEDERKWLWIAVIVVGSVLVFILLVNIAICIMKCCCKNQTRGSGSSKGHRNRESNQFRVDRERIEMNHYEMNGTYRRHESPTLPEISPPRFKIVPADRHDDSRQRERDQKEQPSSRSHQRDEEERQQRAPASVQANRRASSNSRKPAVTSGSKQRQSSSGRNKPKPYVITRHESTSDSSSSDSSIDLPPSRPPSPIPEEPISSTSSGSSEGKNAPVILTRSILLNGQATTSKQTSFQYIPSNLRNHTEASETTDGGNLSTNRAASSGKTPAFVNPAVSALANATKEIALPKQQSTQPPLQPRKGSNRRNY